MWKTKTQVFCDDCGKELDYEKCKGGRRVSLKEYETPLLDFCCSCVNERILHSVSIIPLGRKCKECRGKGKVKDFYGHNEYNWEDCKTCKGMRVIPLKQWGE